jgi:hypothetical protein
MSIIIPEGTETQEEQNQGEELKYQATERDEEEFFLMYHMNMQPSEVNKLDPDYRKWLIARYIGQKHMEREAMQQQRMMAAIGPTLRTNP